MGPFEELVPAGLLFSLTTTKTTTTTRTTKMLPDAIRIRLRCSARRAAACCAAIFSRREGSTLVLLALPMFACPTLSASGGQVLGRCFRTRACAAGVAVIPVPRSMVGGSQAGAPGAATQSQPQRPPGNGQ